jgi:hypothetical protein
MATIMEEIAEKPPQEVIGAAEALCEDNLNTSIGRVIGASSATLHGASMTAIRVRLSEQRARKALTERLAKVLAGGPRKEIRATTILDIPQCGR